jgi:hypothetical protein
LLGNLGYEIKKNNDWYKPEYDEMGQRKFNIDIRDLKVWSDISGGCIKEHWNSCAESNKTKANNFR